MGLDSFACKLNGLNKEEQALFNVVDEGLISGMFSGNGNDGSFRGKVYAPIVQDITGVSLYQFYIPPHTLSDMADALDASDVSTWTKLGYFESDKTGLVKFFRICVENGFGLEGWW